MQEDSLSILIPARNEMFLKNTVEGLLKSIRGNTEILVGLDGEWADPAIPDDERVTVVFYGKSIGQRAITNQLAKLSKAKYVMKLDAHCVLDEGFDVKMMEDMQDDWTMIPTLYNLHAFDWKCLKCGNQWYQSPTPTHCQKRTSEDAFTTNPDCDSTQFERVILFKPRMNRRSYTYRFDKTMHFQYWGGLHTRPNNQGDLIESMSAQGSCFMLTRKKYWELNICDEAHGSWGQQGTEVACKTWFSGGRLIVTKKTWYSHMFRTQGGDFGFPYPQSGKQVENARKYSKKLFVEGGFKGVHDLDWLLDHFKPVPDWHDEKEVVNKVVNKPSEVVNKLSSKPTKGVIYYTHNVGDENILNACRKQLLKGIKSKHIISGSNIPIDFGKQNIVVDDYPDQPYLNMFEKILALLKDQTADVIFFAEHDVLYHPKHFDFIPPEKDKYYYNVNVWKVRAEDGFALKVDDCKQLSGLVAYRDILIKHFEKRLEMFRQGVGVRAMGFEPGTHNRPERVDDYKAESYSAEFPNIDIRHGTNATSNRWKKEEFRNQKFTEGWTEGDLTTIPGWNIKENDFSKFIDLI
jgi:hypothetical protein